MCWQKVSIFPLDLHEAERTRRRDVQAFERNIKMCLGTAIKPEWKKLSNKSI